MNKMTRGTRIPVNMTLDADLVREASTLTSDLSETVERLLAIYVDEERSKAIKEKPGIDAAIAWTNDFVAQHGLPGAEFLPL